MPLRDENILRGSLVRLTALTKADMAELARFQEDSRFWRFMGSEPAAPRPAEAHEEWLAEATKSQKSFNFAIRPLDSDTFLGFGELEGVDWPHGACWLGIGLGDPENWGRGYGRDATELMLDFAFNEMNLHRVGLTVFEYNDRAIALYEKLGFVREGAYREWLLKDGRRYDMLIYGMLRSEWKGRPPAG